MGSEADFTLRRGAKSDRGKALLETDFLLFRGAERVRIAFSDIRGVQAKAGVLRVRHAGGVAAFELGDRAEAWAAKIASPKGRIEKLGVKPGAKLALVGAFEDAFEAEIAASGARVSRGARGSAYDLIFVAAERIADLARVAASSARLAPAGGVWVIYPKGRKDIRESDVLGAGRAAGLTDVKVARFSESHTALKFVTPRAQRKGE